MHKRIYAPWFGLGLALALLLPLAAAAADASGKAPPCVVALGGDITETIYALDAQQDLIGVDSTSVWPEAAKHLPNVGYVRQLNAEGVLALHPQLIIATHDAGPPAVIAQLRSAGVALDILPQSTDAADVLAKVRSIGALLGRTVQAEALAHQLDVQFKSLAQRVAAMPHHPGVLFLMPVGAGSPLAAGRDTAAARIIALAGGRNVIDSYSGYKPISAEALVALKPEVIVLMREREDGGGIDSVLALPGVAQTPAGRQRQIVPVDGQALLGFGPRTAQRAQDLQQHLAAIVP